MVNVSYVERGSGLGTGQGVRKPREMKTPNRGPGHGLAPAQVWSGKRKEVVASGVHTGDRSTVIPAWGRRPLRGPLDRAECCDGRTTFPGGSLWLSSHSQSVCGPDSRLLVSQCLFVLTYYPVCLSTSGSRSVVPGPATLASTRNFVKMHSLRPHPIGQGNLC